MDRNEVNTASNVYSCNTKLITSVLLIYTHIELHVHMNKWLTAMLFMKEMTCIGCAEQASQTPPPG